MRHARILTLIALVALLGVLAGCTGGGGSTKLEEHADEVPEGMPVMYEFFTTT